MMHSSKPSTAAEQDTLNKAALTAGAESLVTHPVHLFTTPMMAAAPQRRAAHVPCSCKQIQKKATKISDVRGSVPKASHAMCKVVQ